jgi:hypothetical protein
MSMNRKTSFSTVSSAPYSGHHLNSAVSDNSGIVSIDMGYLSSKQGAKHIFTALGRQKPTDFHPFSLSNLSIDATDTMASMVTSRKSFCRGPRIDSDVIKHGGIYLRGKGCIFSSDILEAVSSFNAESRGTQGQDLFH